MMTGPTLLLAATAAAAWSIRPTTTTVAAASFTKAARRQQQQSLRWLLVLRSSSSSSSSEPSSLPVRDDRISRFETFQRLLQMHGAPGSQGCLAPMDLFPVTSTAKMANLHPYLIPICQSRLSSNLICAYRNPSTEESSTSTPWPIVEATIGGPGMQLLALNSEHMMRRMVCESDFATTAGSTTTTTTTSGGSSTELIELYNEGLGQGLLKDAALDTPYVSGSVTKLGYGVEKFVLLRVGPFPDLYQQMSRQHFARNDESSALIAAETANGKLSGFGSTFRFYARILSSFANRQEETRDAARMCLRMPLPTIGMTWADFEEVAMLGQMADEADPPDVALAKLRDMYHLMKGVEDGDKSDDKTPIQRVLDDANNLINDAVLTGNEWSSVRPKLAELFRSIGRDEMASFVDL